MSKIADVGGVLSFVFLILSVIPGINSTQEQLDDVANQLDIKTAESVLRSFHFYIEQGLLEEAWDLFSEKKKEQQQGGLEGFKQRHSNVVSFQGFQIQPLKTKDSASSKVFLVEYDLHMRGMKPYDMLLGYSVLSSGSGRIINHTTYPLRKGGVWDEDNACSFYDFEFCSSF